MSGNDSEELDIETPEESEKTHESSIYVDLTRKPNEQPSEICHILNLSDCVMLHLLSFLDATSLYNLSLTCSYLKDIVEDTKLWRYIDARTAPNSTEKVEYCVERMHKNTTDVLLRATNRKIGLVPQSFFQDVGKLSKITILALERQTLNAFKITMNDFPSTLVELSLKKTYVKNAQNFFRCSKNNMSHLRVLILDQCKWLESHFLMSVTKYQSLEIISTIKCDKLAPNAVPYLCIARDGCHNLKIFDCRMTSLGHSLLSIFHKAKALIAFYFQHNASFWMDYNRHLERTVSERLSLDANTTRDRVVCHNEEVITDTSLIEYRRAIGADVMDALPKSVLYKDPYMECNCENKRRFVNPVPVNVDMYDTYTTTNNLMRTLICNKHRRKLRSDNTHHPKLIQIFNIDMDELESDADSSGMEEDASSDDDECCVYGKKLSHLVVLQVINRSNSGNPEPSTSSVNVQVETTPQAQPGPSARTTKRKREDGESSQSSPKRHRSPDHNCVFGNYFEVKEVCLNAPPVECLQRALENIRANMVRVPPRISPPKVPLRRLSLRGYRKVTDVGLGYLKNMNIDLIDLTYTGVTSNGIQQFLTHNPGCRVIHPLYCICKPREPDLL